MAFFVFFFRLCVLAILPIHCMADTSNPSDAVLLVVEVPDKLSGKPSHIQFTMDDLRKMPKVGFETETIWFTGAQHFAGVPLVALMKAIGVTEGTLTVTAADGYSVDIEMSHAAEFGTIIAYNRNGEPMTVRRKGPLRLVYDYDEFPPLVRDNLYSHTVWQITRIEVASDDSLTGVLR